MKNALKAAVAAIAIGSTALVVPSVAEARPGGWHGGHHGYHGGYRGYRGGHRHGDVGLAVGAGLLGLAVGSAIGSNYYDGPRYRGGYYAPYPTYYGGGTCYTRDWVWDPYYGRYVRARQAYPC